MRRRSFIRAATSLVSAGVFGAAGWLMGARTLTMPGGASPPPPPAPCTTFCTAYSYCQYDPVCAYAISRCHCFVDYIYIPSYGTCNSGPYCVITRDTCFCGCTAHLCAF
jgi:hypothetical protein